VNQGELVDLLADEMNRTKAEARETLDVILEAMTADLKKGERVYIRGFGSLRKEKRKARRVRNVQTGKMITIPETETVEFAPSPALVEKMKK
jgi:nucleoid DNA-binding protein